MASGGHLLVVGFIYIWYYLPNVKNATIDRNRNQCLGNLQ